MANHSRKEERELDQIEKGLSFHGDHWEAKYPWRKDPNLLPDNYDYTLKALVGTEKRLKRDIEWRKKYCEQMMDMVNRKVARKLDKEELRKYNGPIHYIAHRAVVKTDANFNGQILNDYWVKGPDAFMNNMLGVLLRFRENYVGIAGQGTYEECTIQCALVRSTSIATGSCSAIWIAPAPRCLCSYHS